MFYKKRLNLVPQFSILYMLVAQPREIQTIHRKYIFNLILSHMGLEIRFFRSGDQSSENKWLVEEFASCLLQNSILLEY